MAEEKTTLEDLKGLTAPAVEQALEEQKPDLDSFGRSYATGKRKNAIARVWVKPGNGKIHTKRSLQWRFRQSKSPEHEL